MAFNGRFIVNIADFAGNLGADAQSFIALSGKTEKELCDESCVVDDATYNTIIEAAVTATDDPFLGLHLGENLNLSAAGLVGQLTQTSKTVKQALELCCQFANLACSALPMQLTEEKDYYKVTLMPNELWKKQSPIAVQHTADGTVAFTIREFHTLTRMKHNPIAIHFPWPQPSSVSEYERVLRCPVHFNKNEISILLKKNHVEEKIVTANYDLLRILISFAEEKLAHFHQQIGFAAMVKQSVIKLVKPSFPTIDQVSSHLNISPRTLQRRLQEENCNYKQLVDELRKEFALNYLKRPDLSIGEIAYLLSYADTSAFTRSFKRWTGKTPSGFRE